MLTEGEGGGGGGGGLGLPNPRPPQEQNLALWESYDSACLIRNYRGPATHILVDQGAEDPKAPMLQSGRLVVAAETNSRINLNYRLQPAYDHDLRLVVARSVDLSPGARNSLTKPHDDVLTSRPLVRLQQLRRHFRSRARALARGEAGREQASRGGGGQRGKRGWVLEESGGHGTPHLWGWSHGGDGAHACCAEIASGRGDWRTSAGGGRLAAKARPEGRTVRAGWCPPDRRVGRLLRTPHKTQNFNA